MTHSDLFHRFGNRKIWFYNMFEENLLQKNNVLPSVTDTITEQLIKHQEQQMLFLADETDLVLLKYELDEDFLVYLQGIGIARQNMKYLNDNDHIENLARSDDVIVPYIITETSNGWRELNRSVFGPSLECSMQWNNKYRTREMMSNHGLRVTEGYFCNTMTESVMAYENLVKQGFHKVVLKMPYGSSGKGLSVISDGAQLEKLLRFINRRNDRFQVLIEGWHPDVRSINAQLFIDEDHVKIINISEQMTDNSGVYLGTNFTPVYNDEQIEQYKTELRKVGEVLRRYHYTGIAGIDSIITNDQVIYPVIEVNARMTQVTYLLKIIERYLPVYPYIESRYFKFETTSRLTFKDLFTTLHPYLYHNDEFHNMIYTFSSYEAKDKTYYKIFVLFMSASKYKNSENINKVTEMISLYE